MHKLHAHTDDMVKRIGQMDDLVKRYTGGYGEAIKTLDEIRSALPQTASGEILSSNTTFSICRRKLDAASTL